MQQAAGLLLLAKRAMPWLLADIGISAYKSYWASMSMHYKTEVLSAIQTTRCY